MSIKVDSQTKQTQQLIRIVFKMTHTKFALLILAAIILSCAQAIDVEPRIEQGENAQRGQFPYYALLNTITYENNQTCGGTLISNQWVVTSGHCLYGAYRVEVHLGSLKTNDIAEKGRVIVTTVNQQDIIMHPNYVDIVDIVLKK